MTESKYKVGDELAVHTSGWGSYWSIFKITKISPTGRITLGNGNYILDPNLRVRSRSRFGPYSAQEVTKEIRDSIRKSNLLYEIKIAKFDTLSLQQLESIAAIIKGEKGDE
jgi:hypothetical protein